MNQLVAVAETFVLSFVEKLIQLEKAAGADILYRITPPITSRLDDVVSIQAVARELADSIGLSQFVFVITFVKQKENVGGHIDLSTKDEVVYIEIEPEAIEFPESVAATLCHEICHKWLQVKGVSSPILMDNEILTDITTVFLGFGKIMLNGCEVTRVQKERVADGTSTTTRTRTSGYLKRDQLAFVYRLVCAMRNVPNNLFWDGLSSAAASAIHACDQLYGHYYSGRFHQPETTVEALKHFQVESIAQQRQMAELNKHLEYVTQSFCETVDNCITDGHKTVETLRKRSEVIAQQKEYDPALRFLRAIKNEHDLGQIAQELAALASRLKALLAHSAVVGHHIAKNTRQFPAPAPKMFNIVKCPKDGTKLRLPEQSADLVVACPTCHYRFAYNTTCVSFEASTLHPKGERPSWVNRIWNKVRKQPKR